MGEMAHVFPPAAPPSRFPSSAHDECATNSLPPRVTCKTIT